MDVNRLRQTSSGDWASSILTFQMLVSVDCGRYLEKLGFIDIDFSVVGVSRLGRHSGNWASSILTFQLSVLVTAADIFRRLSFLDIDFSVVGVSYCGRHLQETGLSRY